MFLLPTNCLSCFFTIDFFVGSRRMEVLAHNE
jgi:hypothetical protein